MEKGEVRMDTLLPLQLHRSKVLVHSENFLEMAIVGGNDVTNSGVLFVGCLASS